MGHGGFSGAVGHGVGDHWVVLYIIPLLRGWLSELLLVNQKEACSKGCYMMLPVVYVLLGFSLKPFCNGHRIPTPPRQGWCLMSLNFATAISFGTKWKAFNIYKGRKMYNFIEPSLLQAERNPQLKPNCILKCMCLHTHMHVWVIYTCIIHKYIYIHILRHTWN